MGILNITPDSFSDGPRYFSRDAAIARAEQIVEQGADLIDLGGESTRPGSASVPAEEQINRVVPVLEHICRRSNITCSIDTTSSEVAGAALNAGATFINDISAARFDEQMLPLAARRHVPIVLMHMQGTPATMQQSPHYVDVIAEVSDFLRERMNAAQAAGVPICNILLDPGIGFGKNLQHNLTLLNRQKELLSLGRPLVIGTSRKKFIGTLTGVDDPSRRLAGTLATTAWAVANGAGIVRVHDVEENVRAVRMVRAILNNSPEI
jgi:dihydropteroate synthase